MSSQDKSKLGVDFEELKNSVRYQKATKQSQKLLIGEYLIQILLKITSDLWKGVFKKHYKEQRECRIAQKNQLTSTFKSYSYEKFLEMELVCKHCHLLLKIIVLKNKRSLFIVDEYRLTKLLMEQLITSWDLCLSDLFKIAKIQEQFQVQILNKDEIHDLIDNLYQDSLEDIHNYKLLDLLANICTPGGKGDKKIQEDILGLIIGKSKPPERFTLLSPERTYIYIYIYNY